MKNLAIAVAAAFSFTATAAAADSLLPVPVMGSVEYAVEAEAISLELGTYVGFGNFGLAPLVNFSGTDAIDFDGAEVTATYMFGSNIDLYATIEADADFEYSEATVGVAFSF